MDNHVLVAGLPQYERCASLRNSQFIQLTKGELSILYEENDFKGLVRCCRKIETYINLKGKITSNETLEVCTLLWEILRDGKFRLDEEVRIFKTVRKLITKFDPELVGKLPYDWKDLLVFIERAVVPSYTIKVEAPMQTVSTFALHLNALCIVSRRYFPEITIIQISDYCSKYFSDPLSRNMFIGQTILTLLIPSVHSNLYSKVIPLWINEYWEHIDRNAEWSAGWMSLISRGLKWGGTDFISNDPKLLAALFFRIQSALRLPSPGGFNIPNRTSRPSYLKPLSIKSDHLQIYAAKVAIRLLGCGSAQEYFVQCDDDEDPKTKAELEASLAESQHLSAGMLHLQWLLNSIHTLFHPSNNSRSTTKIAHLIETLCISFAKRLGRERHDKMLKPMTCEDKSCFMDIVLPLLSMSVYSKSRLLLHCAVECVCQLAYVAPKRVADHFLPIIGDALDHNNLNQTHQAPAAIKLVTVMLQPLLQVYPSSIVTYLPEILMLTVPGLDPNDSSKTHATSMLYQVVLSWIPLVDTSADGIELPEESNIPTNTENFVNSYGIDPEFKVCARDVQMEMWRANDDMLNWAFCCLDRIFMYIDNQGKHAKEGFAEQLDNAIFSGIVITARLLFSQMSPGVIRAASTKVNTWALNCRNIDSMRFAKSVVRSYACGCFATADSTSAHKMVIEGLLRPLASRVLDDSGSDKMIHIALCLLGGIVRVAGSFLIDCEIEITNVIKRTQLHHDKDIRKLGCKLLRRTLRSLSEYYIQSRASSSLLQSHKKEDLAIASVAWGFAESWRTTASSMYWHNPSNAELALADRLYHHFTDICIDTLAKGMKSPDNFKPAECRNILSLLFQSCRGASFVCTTMESRMKMLNCARETLEWLLVQRESDVSSQRKCLKIISILVTTFGASSGSVHMLAGRKWWATYLRETMMSKAYAAEIRARDGNVKDRQDWICPRFQHCDEIHCLFLEEQCEKSYDVARAVKDSGDDQFMVTLLDSLLAANRHTWSETRKQSEEAIERIFERYPWIGKRQVPRVIDCIGSAQKDIVPSALTGAAFLLQWKMITRWVGSDWQLLDQFVRACIFHNQVHSLSDEYQRKANERLQGLFVAVARITVVAPRIMHPNDEIIRRKLVQDLVALPAGTSWRTEILVCVVLWIIIVPEDQLIDVSLLDWLLRRTLSDIIPLSAIAVNVFVQILSHATNGADMIRDLNLVQNTKFFRSLSEYCAHDHAESSTMGDGHRSKESKGRSEWSAGVSELMKLVRVSRSKFYPSTCLPCFSKAYSYRHKLLFEHLLQRLRSNYEDRVTEELNYLLYEDVESAEATSNMCAGAEILSGALSIKADEHLVSHCLKCIGNCSAESSEMWLDAFRGARYGARFIFLFIDKLSEVLTSRDDDANHVQAATMLRLCRALIYDITEIDSLEKCRVKLCAVIKASVGHTFKTVRQELSRMFVALMDTYERRQYPCNWIRPMLEELVMNVDLNSTERESTMTTKMVASLLHISISMMIAGGVIVEKYISIFIPVILLSQGHPNTDVGQVSRMAASCIAGLYFVSQRSGIECIKLIHSCSQSTTNWYARACGVQVLSALYSTNFSIWGYAFAAISVRKMVEVYLVDSQREVQSVACSSLTPILSSFSDKSPSLKLFHDTYAKMSKIRISKEKLKTDEGKLSQLKCLQGVYGLSALIGGFPYTVPFTRAVVILAKRGGDPGNVGLVAKQAILDFKRTHTDSWQQVKHRFTSDELEDLQELSVSHAYA